MKYYSETLKKLFETEEELVRAEEREEKIKAEEAKIKEDLSNKKKAAAKKVEEATLAYDRATEEYEKAKKEIYLILKQSEDEAAKILQKANEEVEERLEAEKKKLFDVKKQKMTAIEEFNKNYGPYKTVLTGENAKKEFERLSNDFDLWLNKLYKWF